MKKNLTIILLGLISSFKAQFANNWLVGNGYGINFSGSSPTIIAGSISGHPDNSSAISDASGNLLFYTTGYTVWNKNHIPMPNGTGLTGSYTGGQCALIVPIPCSTSKYVIFQTTAFSSPGYLSYSVVDMTLNGGLGDVVSSQKNISLGSGWTEKLCAYYNPSGNYYWVLTHRWMSDQFVAFKVDAGSIATNSVISSIGSIHNCGSTGGVHDAMGQLTISPDGTKVINALTCQDKYELFDFNINTGTLSNFIPIAGNGGSAWGTAFSPDSKKIYTDVIFGGALYQYDISVYNSVAINASKTSIYNGPTSGYVFGYMELGPNGKIYIPRPGTNFVSVVNNPNLTGSAASYSFSGLSLGTAITQHGTCRIAYNIPTSSTVTPSYSLTVFSNSVSCNGFSNGSAAVMVNPLGTYSYSWAPGNYTTSMVPNLSSGVYSVTVSNGSCSGNVTSTVSIIQPPAISVFFDPLQICLGNPGSINPMVTGGTPVYTYSWSNGATSLGTVVSPSVTSNFTLTVTDANGCINNAVTTVTVVLCTGIDEKDNEEAISLFPNPTSNSLYLVQNNEVETVSVIDAIGKIRIAEMKLNENNSINLGNLENGIYFVLLHKEGKVIATRKFVKEN